MRPRDLRWYKGACELCGRRRWNSLPGEGDKKPAKIEVSDDGVTWTTI